MAREFDKDWKSSVAKPRLEGVSVIPSMKAINAKEKDFSAVSFFAGTGGASIGYKTAGFNMLYANEFVPIAKYCYEINAPGTIVDGNDIRTLDPKKLLKQLGLKQGELDLMDGSPPCKGFSSAGTVDDGWGKEVLYSEGIRQQVDDLFFEYIRMLEGMKPKTFVAENVSGLVKGMSRGYFVEILRDFKAAGYRVKAFKINPALLGLPQARERLIYMGVRNDLKLEPVAPVPTNKLVTVKDVLPNIALIKSKRRNMLTYVHSDCVSPTITASDGSTSETAGFSCGGYVEDLNGERRKYTIPELKRVFGFPDDFKLVGKFEQQWERLGRSHAPLAVYHIAKSLRKNILEPYYDSKGADYSDNIK